MNRVSLALAVVEADVESERRAIRRDVDEIQDVVRAKHREDLGIHRRQRLATPTLNLLWKPIEGRTDRSRLRTILDGHQSCCAEEHHEENDRSVQHSDPLTRPQAPAQHSPL